MRLKKYLFFLPILLMATSACKHTSPKTMIDTSQFPAPPIAEQEDSVLEAHGDKRIDPYFWMRLSDEQKNAEIPDAQTQKVLDYLNAENSYTKAVLKRTDTLQTKLYDEIVGRIKQDDASVPYFKNGYWYYTRYEEGQEYPIHCRKKGNLEAKEEVMLNVNLLAEGKDYYAASGLSVSPDNKLLAFAEDTVSRRIYTIRFKNLETGEMLSDQLENAEPGGAWAKDSKTFFYTTKNEVSLLSEKIWRHQVGDTQDVMVYHEKDPSYYIGVYTSKSGEYIIIYSSSTLVSDYQILDANTPLADFKSFTPRGTDHQYSIEHFQDKFYILTNDHAKNFRLMETPDDATDMSHWTELIAHREDVLLESFDVFEDYLVLSERTQALTQLRVINQKNKAEHYLDFGEPVYVAYASTNPEFKTSTLRYAYSSMTTPFSIIDYDMDTKEKTVKKVEEVLGGHQPEDYVTERHWVSSRDGQKIPVSLVYKKTTQINQHTPLVLYGYGSYGYNVDPYFSASRLSLLDRGFVWAIAHIRGSQTMGRQWYEDGKMQHKMNTFNDFIDCAQYFVDQKYTSPDHLYAMGGSAGGLLMGAIVNMAPELFNGVIAAVPFVDVVSTMMDESIPLTTNEFDEWGNPKEEEAYWYMKSYSPYDNVGAHDYPHLLVTTGLFDSQVQYWEPAKWVAKLRATKTGEQVLLLHTNMEAGHGGASGRFKRYKETAMEYAFFLMLEGQDE